MATVLVLPALSVRASVVFTTLHLFSGGNDGAEPGTAVVQGKDGSLYGVTSVGGTNNYGTIFKISTHGALTSLYSFTGSNDGAYPFPVLVQGTDGNFYGTTSGGGTNNDGTVFQVSSNGGLVSLYSFTGSDGANPAAALVRGSDGNFYGTTSGGGTNGVGTVFKISAAGALTSLYSFTDTNYGVARFAGLVQGSDGYLYGTTPRGGTNGQGDVFKISTNGVLTSLYSFTGGNDGADPEAGLLLGSDGIFYGTTYNGGTNKGGTVFQITSDGAMTSLHSFTGIEGIAPHAGLVQSSDGNFYGTTTAQGIGGIATSPYGTIFRMSTNGAVTNLFSLQAQFEEGPCFGPLLQADDGNFYGMTLSTGTNNMGTVFRLTIVPEFQAVTLTNGMLNLTWNTEVGGKYQVDFNPTLNPATWTNLDGIITATGTLLSASDFVTNGPQRFYRVAVFP